MHRDAEKQWNFAFGRARAVVTAFLLQFVVIEQVMSETLHGAIQVVEVQGTLSVRHTDSTSWAPTVVNQSLQNSDWLKTGSNSRVTVRWSDQSIITFDEWTEVEILSPDTPESESGLHLIRGTISFFHRDRPGRIRLITAGAMAGVEGTDLALAVNDSGRTTMSVIDGIVSFGNRRGTLLLTYGQQAIADFGAPPVRTAGFVANNILQWCFYYPGVLDLDDVGFTEAERKRLAASIAAYGKGDLLMALDKYPHRRTLTLHLQVNF
jgi:hypothetical protein